MSHFVSFATPLKNMLSSLISSNELHAKWINTLSYLENSGARKIAACEHPTLVKEEMLKHASEEFRHAHHLKKQLEKIECTSLPNYSRNEIIGGFASLNYLRALDLETCRYLSTILPKNKIREAAYLLVTYAIELRANELYAIYDELLRKIGSKVGVKSIILEEKEHLNEMIAGLNQMPSGMDYAAKICEIEGKLCQEWIDSITKLVA